MRLRAGWCSAALGAIAALGALACGEELPPYAEAIVVVDVAARVPNVVERVRIDLYDASGTWFESRDVARPDARDWPVSFSVFSDDEAADKRVWLRVRAYPEGRVRDYRGERYEARGGARAEPEGDGEPRLVREGRDQTPSTEPEPLTAIDQLALIVLTPGVRGPLRITLDPRCAGTMPILDDLEAPSTCLEEPDVLEPVRARRVETDEPIDLRHDNERPRCAGSAPYDAVCVPGGAALLGSSEIALVPDLEPRPERMVVHSPFFIDRYEVSVARFREALANGFVPSLMPFANEGPLTGDVDGSCTFSEAPRDREGYGLSCMTWTAARELCQWLGGDLPTEAQLEHAATLASDEGRSHYAWGDEPPSCERASYGRVDLAGFPGVCEHLGRGPEALTVGARGDVTREGVVGLAGGLTEWTRDDYAAYDGACWGDTSVVDPWCEGPLGNKTVRGASWAAPPTYLPSTARIGTLSARRASFLGFRCVYAAETEP